MYEDGDEFESENLDGNGVITFLCDGFIEGWYAMQIPPGEPFWETKPEGSEEEDREEDKEGELGKELDNKTEKKSRKSRAFITKQLA